MTLSLTRVWRDPFLRKSAIFFTGSLIVAFLNYLYYPVLGRWLSLQDFGEVQAILAVFTQITTILSAFSLATVHASVNCELGGECEAVVQALRSAALVVVGVFFTVLLFSAHSLAVALHFQGPTVFLALALLLITTTLFSTRQGFLQGQGKFFAVSRASTIVSGGRILFAVLAIWLGGRAFGAVFGLVTAQLVALLFVTFLTRKTWDTKGAATFVLTRTRRLHELGYVFFIACSMAYVTALYNADVLIVKRYFAPETAGIYSGIATVAKIVFFVTGPFAAVLLSAIKRRDTVEHRRRVFLKAFLLIASIGGGVTLLFAVAPVFFIKILMGSRYLPYAHLLPILGLAFYLVCLTNVNVYLGLALRRRMLLLLAFLGSVLFSLLALFHHDTLDAIATNMLLTGIFAFVSTLGLSLWNLRAPSGSPSV